MELPMPAELQSTVKHEKYVFGSDANQTGETHVQSAVRCPGTHMVAHVLPSQPDLRLDSIHTKCKVGLPVTIAFCIRDGHATPLLTGTATQPSQTQPSQTQAEGEEADDHSDVDDLDPDEPGPSQVHTSFVTTCVPRASLQLLQTQLSKVFTDG